MVKHECVSVIKGICKYVHQRVHESVLLTAVLCFHLLHSCYVSNKTQTRPPDFSFSTVLGKKKKGTNCSGGWCSVLKKKVGQPQIAWGELCKPDNGINWAAEREVSADDTFAQLSVCLSAEHMLAPEQPPSCPAAAVFSCLSRVTRMHHKFSLVLQNAKQGGLLKE